MRERARAGDGLVENDDAVIEDLHRMALLTGVLPIEAALDEVRASSRRRELDVCSCLNSRVQVQITGLPKSTTSACCSSRTRVCGDFGGIGHLLTVPPIDQPGGAERGRRALIRQGNRPRPAEGQRDAGDQIGPDAVRIAAARETRYRWLS